MEKKETYHILEDEKTTVLTKKQFEEELDKAREEGVFTKEELGYLISCTDIRDKYTKGDSDKKLVDVEKLRDKLSKLKE